jgi:hypothetical protein
MLINFAFHKFQIMILGILDVFQSVQVLEKKFMCNEDGWMCEGIPSSLWLFNPYLQWSGLITEVFVAFSVY